MLVLIEKLSTYRTALSKTPFLGMAGDGVFVAWYAVFTVLVHLIAVLLYQMI